ERPLRPAATVRLRHRRPAGLARRAHRPAGLRRAGVRGLLEGPPRRADPLPVSAARYSAGAGLPWPACPRGRSRHLVGVPAWLTIKAPRSRLTPTRHRRRGNRGHPRVSPTANRPRASPTARQPRGTATSTPRVTSPPTRHRPTG